VVFVADSWTIPVYERKHPWEREDLTGLKRK